MKQKKKQFCTILFSIMLSSALMAQEQVKKIEILSSNNEFLTFQSLASGKNIFTKNVELAYYDINRTMVIIDYPEGAFEKSLAKIQECRSKEDYYKYQPYFAAKPNFKLSLLNNMPWFKNYEVLLNGKKVEVKDATCLISLSEGNNELKIYAVNEMGVKGVPTTIKFKYE